MSNLRKWFRFHFLLTVRVLLCGVFFLNLLSDSFVIIIINKHVKRGENVPRCDGAVWRCWCSTAVHNTRLHAH